MRKLYLVGAIVLIAAIAGYFYVQHRLSAPFLSDEDIAQIKADVIAQDETAFANAARRDAVRQPQNPLKNVYFGDLHGHSSLSFDSYIFGNRLDLDASYRFAKGERLTNPGGEAMQLTVPLDFAAMTDHAEGFGLQEACGDAGITQAGFEFCQRLERPGADLFLELRSQGEIRPPVSSLKGLTENEDDAARFAEETWKAIVATADKHNDPGTFTTFAAYEYSPPLPDRGKIHRNVIFANNTVPTRATSAFDALTELDLWDALTMQCTAPCSFLTIPHNPNKTWGLAFASHTIDGDAYTIDDWKRREQVEPAVEMFQIKGNSECALGAGTTDEECSFEQFLPRCEPGQETGCIFPTSMARDGLKKGLLLEQEIGFNPLRFGMIGSTDGHNSNPGDAEETDFRGMAGLFTASAKLRLSPGPNGNYDTLMRNPGGLAAIWAEENTRESLFAAIQRKEVYATSGTRIRLRFFASFEFADDVAASPDAVGPAYRTGVPMGSVLRGNSSGFPSFLTIALRDPDSAPLDKVQIVKGWIENGQLKESVHDIACSDNRQPDPKTDRCPASAAAVNLTDCSISGGVGETQFNSVWTDQQYSAEQNAFYYVRVLENPTCRWSTFDALRLGVPPPEQVPSTVNEMAWSSPIWINSRAID